jgi:amino acid transporter
VSKAFSPHRNITDKRFSALTEEKPAVFLRKASGLTREWSMFDVFAFQSWLQPFMLAYYIFTTAVFFTPVGNLIIAILISIPFTIAANVVYTMMVSSMPRTGGDYIWQSRILHPLIGFVVIFCGWVVVLQTWVPIIDVIYVYQSFAPMAAIAGNVGLATWMMSNDGIFWTSMASIVFMIVSNALGLRWYARVQKFFFWTALAGCLITVGVFAVYSQSAFIAGYNNFYHNVLGLSSTTPYQDVLTTATTQGLIGPNLTGFNWDLGKSLPLVPLITFYSIYSIWGAPMYGEVKGADSVKKSFWSFQIANVPMQLLCILFLLVTWNVVGYDFWNGANALFWTASASQPLFPFPGWWVYFLTGNLFLTFFILFFNGMMNMTISGGENYLLISRMTFAMAFDRLLPSWFGTLKSRWRVPVYSYLYITIITIIITWLYAYNVYGFRTVTLDGTVVLALGFLFTAVAALLLPRKLPRVWKVSPASKYGAAMAISAVLWIIFSLWCIVAWIINPLYGVNNPISGEFLGVVYVAGAALFLLMRAYRKRQGIELENVFKEIPTA